MQLEDNRLKDEIIPKVLDKDLLLLLDSSNERVPNPTKASIVSPISNDNGPKEFEQNVTENLGNDQQTEMTIKEVAFTDAEKDAFKSLSPFLRHNPRHLKRIINIYILIRALAKHKNEITIIRDPKNIICWIIICSQWPYTMNRMLRSFDDINKNNNETNAEEIFSKTDPLIYLLKKAEGETEFNKEKQATIDYDLDHLHKLLEFHKGNFSWHNLELFRRYTINFNPILDDKMKP